MKKKRSFGRTVLKWIGGALAAFFAVTLLWVLILKWVPVLFTPLMIGRAIEYRDDPDFRTRKTWKSLDEISPALMKAVITAEDNKFMEHKGFDFESIRDAAETNRKRGKIARGASTISQQTAKNVFLWSGRSWVRKGFEVYFTVLIENIWGKERIMEVYLNVIELGKGVYGAEAAARKYFNEPASKISTSQACLMAACLPNPIKRDISNPGKYTRGYAQTLQSRINNLAYPDWITRPGSSRSGKAAQTDRAARSGKKVK